jgi:hypothetical protein
MSTPITIKGIKLTELSVDLSNERKVSSSYALISSLDKVLAKQSVGGYGGLDISPSAATQEALDAFLRLYKKDITDSIGLFAE